MFVVTNGFALLFLAVPVFPNWEYKSNDAGDDSSVDRCYNANVIGGDKREYQTGQYYADDN